MKKRDLPIALRNLKSFSNNMEKHLSNAPVVNETDRKKRKSTLLSSLKDNQRRLDKLKALSDPPLSMQDDAYHKRQKKKLILEVIINKQIVRLQEMQVKELARIEASKTRRMRLAATMNEELVRLEKGKLVPKKKVFRHQDEINKVFGPSDLAKHKQK